MSDIVKMGLKLLIITTIAALILGYTYMVTEEPIAAQIEAENNNARKAVLHKSETFEKLEHDKTKYPDIIEVFKGLSGNDTEGYAIKVAGKGYGGAIEILVGISTDNTIQGMKVLSHSETPGLGAKASTAEFADQYKGISSEKPVEESDVNAITGATITSNAVRNAVNVAISYAIDELGLEAGN